MNEKKKRKKKTGQYISETDHHSFLRMEARTDIMVWMEFGLSNLEKVVGGI